MPYYSFKEIWTPLKLIGILFFRETTDGRVWIKVGSQRRRPLRKIVNKDNQVL